MKGDGIWQVVFHHRDGKCMYYLWYSMRGYNIRGHAGRCCTKAPYYASNERAGEWGLEIGDQLYTWVRPR